MINDFQNAIALKCPSCGSPMGVPDLQGLVKCGYCGTQVVLPRSEEAKENKNFARYKELSKVAKQANNWKDLLKYTNEILEIDPKNVDGWIDKALATGSLSTAYIPRLDEAMGYLQQAEELSPDDVRIADTKTAIQEVLFNWYMHLGSERNKTGVETIQTGRRLRTNVGNQFVVKWLGEAMHYFIEALKIKPDDPNAQQSIRTVSENGKIVRIQWNQEVQQVLLKLDRARTQQIATEQRTRAQQAAAKELILFNEKLKKRQAELAKLKQKKGFFVKMEIEDVQDEIKNLSASIRQLETTARGGT